MKSRFAKVQVQAMHQPVLDVLVTLELTCASGESRTVESKTTVELCGPIPPQWVSSGGDCLVCEVCEKAPGPLPAPADPYSISKLEAEEALGRIARETGMEAVILRPPLVYGRGVGGNFARLVRLVRRGWYLPLASVRNRRSLIGVENLCSLITLCLTHPAAANRILLVSDGRDLSTPELICEIAQACGVASRLLPFPPLLLHFLARLCGRQMEIRRLTGSLQLDSSQTSSLLDWRPPVSLEEGLRQGVC